MPMNIAGKATTTTGGAQADLQLPPPQNRPPPNPPFPFSNPRGTMVRWETKPVASRQSALFMNP